MKLFRYIVPILFLFLSLCVVGQEDKSNDTLDLRGELYRAVQSWDEINDSLVLNSNQSPYDKENIDCRKCKCILIIVAKKTLVNSTIEQPHRIVSYSCPEHTVEHYSTDMCDFFKIYFKKSRYKGQITFAGIKGDEMTLKFAKRKYDYVQTDGISALVFNAYTHSIYVKPQPCEQIDAFLYDALSYAAQAQPPIKDGAILAEFSVSDSTKVYFSQGNLQYQASSKTWRFAEHQWDFVGDSINGNVYENGVKSDNAKISSTYDGWIDNFGWGTSGYNGKNPYMTSMNCSDYGDGYNDIAGTNYDWGVYNAISNGGNQAGQWRTLTQSEWSYVIGNRTDARYLRESATVNGVNGLILLPDNWTLPTGVTFTHGGEHGWSQNTYSASDWSKMEANGAVFLPAAGSRYGTYVYGVGSYGDYWSSSAVSNRHAYFMYFYSSYVTTRKLDRFVGRSVRLVQDVKK
ncbi:MAG: hypothetical protein J6W37_07015 [Bacteroidales bacterium]|nr:hypothetical protein [Bacteroidales bacterium]